jgi:hypothetical protein
MYGTSLEKPTWPGAVQSSCLLELIGRIRALGRIDQRIQPVAFEVFFKFQLREFRLSAPFDRELCEKGAAVAFDANTI